MFQHVEIRENILDNKIYDHIYSVEEVNKLVLRGFSFRDAYKKVGKDISEGNFTADKVVEHTHEGSIGNLCLDEISEKFKSSYENK